MKKLLIITNKLKFTQEAMQDMKLKKLMKERENNSQILNKLEYQKMCEERAKDEENKEDKYKKFFKDYENNMNSRMKSHVNLVVKDQLK